MKKQYYFRLPPRGYDASDVGRLVTLNAGFPRREVRFADIAELDEPFCLERSGQIPTYREIAEAARLIGEADLGFPIILNADGRVMKALNAGMETNDVVRFEKDPKPG